VLFINFRADRARELTQAFVEDDFQGFDARRPKLAGFVCMTEYLAGLPADIAFPPDSLPDLFGDILSRNGLRQLRIAETEKYAHVTFFFNGGQEAPFDNEERILVPSPDVATYDLQPEMSAPEVARRLDEAIRSGRFDVIICNIANPDMVGHTGKLEAAIAAVEAVDSCLAVVRNAVGDVGGELLVTADHGNVEQMSDPESGQSHTAHTTNPVPLVFEGRPAHMSSGGSLQDIAPTMLYLLGLPRPEAMTGRPLLELREKAKSVA
jgi:2,3-bisphosphoglycerate-independent phosphoglycerate mutase